MAGDLTTIRRRGQNRDITDLLCTVIGYGYDYKLTKKGIIVYGPHGIAGTHFSVSDHRAAKNLRADFRRVGITTEKG